MSGGGGLVSTAHDYARFCLMFYNGGILDGVRLISRKTVEQMTSNQIPPGYKSSILCTPNYLAKPQLGNRSGIWFGLWHKLRARAKSFTRFQRRLLLDWNIWNIFLGRPERTTDCYYDEQAMRQRS